MLPFQLGLDRMAPAKTGGEKGGSAINEVVPREYTINGHTCIHGMGFKKCATPALREIQKFAMMEMELQMCTSTPDSAKLSVPKE